MKRSRKISLLSMILRGETDSINDLIRRWRTKPPIGEELHELPDQLLLRLIDSGVRIDVKQLDDRQLKFIVDIAMEENGFAKVDYSTLTDEELYQMIAELESTVDPAMANLSEKELNQIIAEEMVLARNSRAQLGRADSTIVSK